MLFQVTESVEHEALIEGAVDAHGNTESVYTPAVTVGVYGFDPGSSSEPREPGHERVISEPTLYLPPGVTFDSRDRVTVRGVLYEVEGDTREWRHELLGPRGNVVTLREVKG